MFCWYGIYRRCGVGWHLVLILLAERRAPRESMNFELPLFEEINWIFVWKVYAE